MTLDCNARTLAAYPERVYQWISDAGIVVPELLLVPLYIGGAPLGTLWVVSDEDRHFDSGDAKTLSELAGFVGIALRMAQNETRLRRALDEQETVAKEMSHRLMNVFAMADGIIRASAKNAQTPEAMARALSGRLHALANAHSIVRRKVSDIQDGAVTTDLAELVHVLTLDHALEGDDASSFSVTGPPVACGEHTTNGIALLIHELVTNAVKYGALSAREGHVTITWTSDGDDLMLSWTETGGPVIAGPPTRSGFGTTLAERTIKGQFDGSIRPDWRATGLVVYMTLRVDRMAH